MKHILIPAFLLLATAALALSKYDNGYRVTKCVSGNCQNGFGEAEMKDGDFVAKLYYKGNFKNGMRNGEGQTFEEDKRTLYVGTYKDNIQSGYGVLWQTKPGKDVYGTPDSANYVSFRKYKDEDNYIAITVKVPGDIRQFQHYKKDPYQEDKTIKDSKLNEMANAFLLAKGSKSAEQIQVESTAKENAEKEAYEKRIVAAKDIKLEHGEWQEIYFNTLLNKRSYYPSFDLKGDKDFKVLPPNVTIYYRIYDDKGTLLKDFTDNYWGDRVPFKPAADGNYKVMIRYLQDAKATASQYLRPQMKLFWRLRYFGE